MRGNVDQFVQLSGPHGAFYIRPSMVCSIGVSDTHDLSGATPGRPVRVVTTSGTSMYVMWDEPENVEKLLG